jgi:hypothetical protein
MIECPKCHHRFPENTASREAFELFHAIRDEYARAQGLSMVEAKDVLCVSFGVSLEYGDDFAPPKWPGVFCEVWGRRFFRKSTLAYTKAEMSRLIESSQEAVYQDEGRGV